MASELPGHPADRSAATEIVRPRSVLAAMGHPEAPTLAGAAAHSPGTGLLGRYPIIGVLGRGGMGEVLSVLDEDLGREVAAKVILGEPRPDQLHKFILEARITGQLQHPSIVPAYELGQSCDGGLYLAMKQVDGADLAEVIARAKRERQRSPAGGGMPGGLLDLLQVFLKVCDGMAFAHSKGVVHRDLKPANIMVGEFGEVLVMDWGLAKIIGDDIASDPGATALAPDLSAAEGDALRTLDGTVMGTPAYMPPEQAEGRIADIDARSDIYSLGAILYEILTLERPYTGGTPWAVLAQVTEGPPLPPAERVGDTWTVPWELEAVVRRAMATRRGERYPDVPSLSADIEAFLAGRALAAADYTPVALVAKWIRRNKALTAAVAAVVLISVSLVALYYQQRAADHRNRIQAARDRVRDAVAGLPTPERLTTALSARHAASPSDPLLGQLEALLSDHLDAVSIIDRALDLAPDDPDLLSQRRTAGHGLGLAALLNRDYALATRSMSDLADFGLEPTQAAALAQIVTDERERVLRWRRGQLEKMLADLASGPSTAGQRFVGWVLRDYVIEASSYRDAQTARILGAALEPLIVQAGEETAGAWTASQRELAKFCSRVLGRIGVPEAMGPLVRWAGVVQDGELVVEVGRALCHTGRPEAHAVLMRQYPRWPYSAWLRIKPLLAHIAPSRDDVDAGALDAKALYDRGIYLLDRQQYTEAITLFTQGLSRFGKSHFLLGGRGLARMKSGDNTGAIADYDRAIARHAGSSTYHTWRGAARLNLGRYQAAIEDLDQVVALQPRHPGGYSYRTVANLALGNFEQAARDIRTLRTMNPDDPDVYKLRAELRLRRGEFEDARADLRLFEQLGDMAVPDALADLGKLRLMLGDYQVAGKHLTRAVQLRPTDARSWYLLGQVRRNLGQLKEAEAAYSKAIDLEGSRADPWAYRGVVRTASGRPAAGLEDLTQAIKLDPKRPTWYVQRATVYRQLRDSAKSRADLDTALSIDPENPHTLYSSAVWRTARGQHQRALAELDRAVRGAPNNAAIWTVRGTIKGQLGDISGALADQTEAIRLAPRAVAGYMNRGTLYLGMKRYAEAIRDFEQGIKLTPGDWRPRHNLGIALMHKGDVAGASNAFKAAIARAPAGIKPRIEQVLRSLRQ